MPKSLPAHARTCDQLHGTICEQPCGLPVGVAENNAARGISCGGSHPCQPQGNAVGKAHVSVVPHEPDRCARRHCRRSSRKGRQGKQGGAAGIRWCPASRSVRHVACMPGRRLLHQVDSRCPALAALKPPWSIHAALGNWPPHWLSSQPPPSSHPPDGTRAAAAAATASTSSCWLAGVLRSKRDRLSPPGIKCRWLSMSPGMM